MDVALEIRLGEESFRLRQQRFLAAALHHAALVEGQSAEAAAAEAAPAGGEGELHFGQGRHAAGLVVAGMPAAAVGQAVDPVQLGAVKGPGRRVGHHEFVLAVGLDQPFSGYGVAVFILQGKASGVFPPVLPHAVEGGQHDAVEHGGGVLGLIHGAVHVGDLVDGQARVQGFRYLHHGAFAHAEGDEIGLGVQQQGTLQGIGPVIVVGQPSQGGFDAADDDGDIAVDPPHQVGIDHAGVVRPKARASAGGVGVGAAPLFGHGVVVHHGVHVAAGDQKGQPRLAADRDGIRVLPVGLGDDGHLEAMAFQHPADDGRPEGGVVHVGVGQQIDEVRLLPAPLLHILFVYRQKAVHRAIVTEIRRKGNAAAAFACERL